LNLVAAIMILILSLTLGFNISFLVLIGLSVDLKGSSLIEHCFRKVLVSYTNLHRALILINLFITSVY